MHTILPTSGHLQYNALPGGFLTDPVAPRDGRAELGASAPRAISPEPPMTDPSASQVNRPAYDSLAAREKRVVDAILKRVTISRDTSAEFDEKRTVGQRLADQIASFGGSWPFIIIFLVSLGAWVLLNTALLRGKAFDPYPYILLNLFLSMLASLQAPIILMSQNRVSARDRLDASHDYEVNLKAEMEIQQLHEKIDQLQHERWSELIKIQDQQVKLLQELCSR